MNNELKMLIALITSTLFEMPEKSVPSGILWANLMGRYTFEQYNITLDALIGCGYVKRDASHLLTLLPAGYSIGESTSKIFNESRT